MRRVLYVEASPRKQRSVSIEIARTLLESLQAQVENLAVDTLDVWSTKLPEFDGDALAAKYAGLNGRALTEEQRRAWAEIGTFAARFRAADLLLFAVPLWNWGIPYKLKQLIDVVSQKDLLFSFDERGFRGLLEGTKAVVIYARGLDYAPSSDTPAGSYDLQRPYMETWLRFIGVREIESIVVQKTLFGPGADLDARLEGKRRAAVLAQHIVADRIRSTDRDFAHRASPGSWADDVGPAAAGGAS